MTSTGTADILHVIELIAAVGVAISSLELIHIHTAMRDDGLLSWWVHRLTCTHTARLLQTIRLDRLLQYPAVLALIFARLIACFAILASILAGKSTTIFVTTIAISGLLLTLRSPEGNDGSDQMASILFVTAAVCEINGTDEGRVLGLSFIAAQSALAYATSGFLKATESGWWDGQFVLGILKTSSFGNLSLLRLAERMPLIAVAFGYIVVLSDCLMGAVILTPPSICRFLLVVGLSLHVGIAVVMGLNTFLWSFVATYTALLWASIVIYRHFGC